MFQARIGASFHFGRFGEEDAGAWRNNRKQKKYRNEGTLHRASR
jgi:hypothetical protein